MWKSICFNIIILITKTTFTNTKHMIVKLLQLFLSRICPHWLISKAESYELAFPRNQDQGTDDNHDIYK